MWLLVLGPEERARLAAIRRFAEANPFSLERIRAAAEGCERLAVDAGYSTVLPVDIGVTFTVEVHPAGPCRHVSVCLGKVGAAPQPAVVSEIARELGMSGALEGDGVASWAEPVGEFTAINLVERIGPPGDPEMGDFPTRRLADGRVLTLYPLTFGRARVGIGPAGEACFEDEW